MSLAALAILSDRTLLGQELIALTTGLLPDAPWPRGRRIVRAYRNLVKIKDRAPALTLSGQYLVNCLANRFRDNRFEFSAPRACFIPKRKDWPKAGGSYPFAGVPDLQKLALALAGDETFLSHWRVIGPVPPHDTLVQRILLAELRPRIDPLFSPHSHAFRADARRFSVASAARRFEDLAQTHNLVLKLDIVRFFDEVDHGILARLCHGMLIQAGYQEAETLWIMGILEKFMTCAPRMLARGTAARVLHAKGIVQGGALSPLLANIYLHPLDLFLESMGCVFTRYADDIVVFCHSPAEAEERRRNIDAFLLSDLRLRSGNKVRIAAPCAGTDYLGCVYDGANKHVRATTLDRFKSRIQRLTRPGQRKKNGEPCKPGYVIRQINKMLGFVSARVRENRPCQYRFRLKYCRVRFLAEHYREFDGLEEFFKRMDRYIRFRIRRYSREFYRLTGRAGQIQGHLSDAFFRCKGLKTLKQAYARSRAAIFPDRGRNCQTVPDVGPTPW